MESKEELTEYEKWENEYKEINNLIMPDLNKFLTDKGYVLEGKDFLKDKWMKLMPKAMEHYNKTCRYHIYKDCIIETVTKDIISSQ